MSVLEYGYRQDGGTEGGEWIRVPVTYIHSHKQTRVVVTMVTSHIWKIFQIV